MTGTVFVKLRIKPVHTSVQPNLPAPLTDLQRQLLAWSLIPSVAAMKRMQEAMEQVAAAAREAITPMDDVVRVARKAQTPPPWAGNISRQHRPKGNR